MHCRVEPIGSRLGVFSSCSASRPQTSSSSASYGRSPRPFHSPPTASSRLGSAGRGAVQQPPLTLLRSALRQCDCRTAARELIRFLMEQKDLPISPMNLLQDEYGRCMQAAFSDIALFASSPADESSGITLHEQYVKTAAESLAKDARIIDLQERLSVSEASLSRLRHATLEGAGGHSGILPHTMHPTSAASQSRAQESNDELGVPELQALNSKMSDYIDTLEHNIANGFMYSDVQMKNVILDLELEREHVLARCMQLAEHSVQLQVENVRLNKSLTKAELQLRNAETRRDQAEADVFQLRSEMEAMRRTYETQKLSESVVYQRLMNR